MLRSEPRGDGGDHRGAGDDPGVAAISGWEPRLSSYCVFGKLLYNSSPVFTSITITLILVFRITRAGVGVGDDGARDDGQEQTCPLCSPVHGNNHHHLDQCPLLETILSIFSSRWFWPTLSPRWSTTTLTVSTTRKAPTLAGAFLALRPPPP